MFEIFGLGYVFAAAGFFYSLSKTAKPVQFPLWIWQQRASAEIIEIYSDVEKAA